MILDRIHEVFHQRKVAKLRAEIAAKQHKSTELHAQAQQNLAEARAEQIAELRRCNDLQEKIIELQRHNAEQQNEIIELQRRNAEQQAEIIKNLRQQLGNPET